MQIGEHSGTVPRLLVLPLVLMRIFFFEISFQLLDRMNILDAMKKEIAAEEEEKSFVKCKSQPFRIKKMRLHSTKGGKM